MLLIQFSIKNAVPSKDTFISDMGNMMKEKFGSYLFKHNLILVIAIVMDPRYKMNFVAYVFYRIYGGSTTAAEKVHSKLKALFNLYSPPTTTSTPVEMSPQSGFHGSDLLMEFESFENEGYEASNQKTQLELNLMEPKMKITDKLDVLDLWKSNQFRYPELSRMAGDILSIPVSTVASESAFSLGGRVIDQYRSALLPENVQALVCTSNWLFGMKDVVVPKPEELMDGDGGYHEGHE